MQLPPLSVIENWPKANYINPTTAGPILIVVISILIGVVTVILGIRLYTRRVISKGLGLDDVLILLAFIPSLAFGILGIVGVTKFQWDRHVWDVSPDLLEPGLAFGIAVQIIFDIGTSMTKLSMLALLHRIAAASSSQMRFFVYLFGTIIALNCLLFVLITIFQCSPVSDYWTLSFTPQKCLNEEAHLLAAGTINTVTDVIIVLLPIRTVMDLQLPKRQRLIVYILFAGGFLASIAGAVRTYFVWRFTSSPDYDLTWNSYYAVLTSSIELFIGIICASIPATKPFFSRYVPRLMNMTTRDDVTEPLAMKKGSHFKSFTTGDRSHATFNDVEAGIPMEKPREMRPPLKRAITAAYLNKPLPRVRLDIDRTFNWDDLEPLSPTSGSERR